MPSSPGRYSSLLILSPKSWINARQDRSPIRKSNECVVETPQAYTTESSSPWRPIYLSKRVLAEFLVTFSALTSIVQIILLSSNRNRGLPGANDGLHRALWTYGPTAILTLVASFWTRLECQTKTTVPWLKMAHGYTTARRSLVLDYLSQFQPFSIVSAIKNEDYTVAAVTTNSLLIRALLVLSTSLCSLSPTQIVRSNVPLTLRSEFVNSVSGLTGNGSLAYASFASMMIFGTSLPQGTSAKYAYQLIESEFLDTPSTISTTLDGFSGGLECEPALLPASSTLLNSSYGNSFPISSNSCSFNVTPDIVLLHSNQDGDHLVGLQPGGCGGSSDLDDKRVAIIIAIIGSPGGYDNMTISKSNSLICKPTYQIQQLEFSARGPDRFVSRSANADSRVLNDVHPWSIMNSHIEAVPDIPIKTENSATISNQTVYFDRFGFLAYLFANASGNPPELSTIFEDQDGAKTFISNYYQQYTALLAHTSLMQPVSSPSEGTATEVMNRFLGKHNVESTELDCKIDAKEVFSERHNCQYNDRNSRFLYHHNWPYFGFRCVD